MSDKIRTIFFGTPEFAASSLEALLKNTRLEVVAAVTQPDRPVGRKKVMTPPPVKTVAQKFGIKVFQPEKLRDEKIQDEILAEKPELCVVVAYGNLIPKRLLEAVPHGFVNIHPSILPKHRGAAPITASILGGDEETGVCLMVLDVEMDHGPIIACRRAQLDSDETTDSLRKKLAPIGAEMLSQELIEWLDGKIVPQPQNHAAATFCKPLESKDAKIDWSKSVAEIDRLVRAMCGITPAWTTLDGSAFLVHKSFPVADSNPSLKVREGRVGYEPAGVILEINKKLAAACADGYLILEEVQPAGGKPMSGQAFLNGHKDILGKILQ